MALLWPNDWQRHHNHPWLSGTLSERRGASQLHFIDQRLALVHSSLRQFCEPMAEGRGKAQADTLRKNCRDVQANKLAAPTTALNSLWSQAIL